MPWKIVKHSKAPEGQPGVHCIYKENADGTPGKLVACHESHDKAAAQLRALYASEADKAIDATGQFDGDENSTKAGRRMNARMAQRLRDALATIAEVAKWAGYEDAKDDSEDADEDDMDEAKCVKALSDDRIGGYLILWGDASRKDLTGEYFTPRTGEFDAIFKAMGKLPALYHHGMDATLKSAVVGAIDVLKVDEIGVWAEAQLNKANEYATAIMELVRKRALGWSSGALPGSRKVAPDGHIERWAIVEGTLTPSPAEPRMRLERPIAELQAAYKSIGLELPTEEPAAQGAEDAQTPAVKGREIETEIERLKLLQLEVTP